MDWKLINSRFPGKCVVCGGEIATGAQVYWKRRQAAHVACIDSQGLSEESRQPEPAEPREEKARPLPVSPSLTLPNGSTARPARRVIGSTCAAQSASRCSAR